MSNFLKLALAIALATCCMAHKASQVGINAYPQWTHLEMHQNLWKALKEKHADLEDLLTHQLTGHSELLVDSLNRQFQANVLNTLELESEDSNISNISAQCLAATQRFATDLLQRKTYTIQALDATGKLPPGLLSGNFLWTGSVDGCRNTTHHEEGSIGFTGKYCTTFIKVQPTVPVLAGQTLQLGLCVPSVCTEADVMGLFNEGVINLPAQYQFGWAYGVLCAVNKEWTGADIAALCTFIVIAFLVLCGTLYDIISCWQPHGPALRISVPAPNPIPPNDAASVPDGSTVNIASEGEIFTSDSAPEGEGQPLTLVPSPKPSSAAGRWAWLGIPLLCFSVRTNTRKLLSTQQHEGHLSALNGIRVLSMWWVILGHTHLFLVSMADNPIIGADIIARFTFQAVVNATVSVDTFFFLSGLLVSYLSLRTLDNGGLRTVKEWLIFYFHRVWRLTPLYGLVIFFWATLYLHIPDGINMRAVDSSTACQQYWWTNLLYINNFIPYDLNGECLGWSWYLANDMQFFALSPLFIFLLHTHRLAGRKRWIGLLIILLVAILSVSITGIIATVKKLGLGIQQQGHGSMSDSSVYVKPWCRIAPYLIGMITGFVLLRSKGQLPMKKWLAVIGWLVSMAVGMAIVYGLWKVYRGEVTYSQAVDSLYIATHRATWALCLSWVTLACMCGYGGPINALLSWEAWVPLARLTYGAYLVHPMVIYVYVLSMKTPLHYTDLDMVYIYIGNVVLSYLVAAIVSVCIEAPTLALEKAVMKRKTH